MVIGANFSIVRMRLDRAILLDGNTANFGTGAGVISVSNKD